MENVILVDNNDTEIGVMEKLQAHERGILHRAFSILLFNTEGNMLLQKRALHKYHSPGLWTNTCCSHPRPGESMEKATQRRLKEEMGIHVPLEFKFKFIYKARLENLIEHEYDHVFIGTFNGTPIINQEEVADWKFIHPSAIADDMERNPEHYSVWFHLIMDHLSSHTRKIPSS
jgi:isopentenyl-diphosphate Delta-isomerase